MANSDGKPGSKNTFQKVVEAEKAKIPSKFQMNRTLFSWESNDRFAYNFTAQQKTTYALLVLLIGLYFLWVGQPIITVTVGAIFFMIYVLYTIPASRVKHAIESVGIHTSDEVYVWDDLVSFWFAEREGTTVLYVETRLTFPARLIILIDTFEETTSIANELIQHIPYKVQRRKQGYFERMMDGEYVDPSNFIIDRYISITGEKDLIQSRTDGASQTQKSGDT